jgi:hypothetical protein
MKFPNENLILVILIILLCSLLFILYVRSTLIIFLPKGASLSNYIFLQIYTLTISFSYGETEVFFPEIFYHLETRN